MSYRADKLGDGRTDGRTDAGNDNTRRPILASGKNWYILCTSKPHGQINSCYGNKLKQHVPGKRLSWDQRLPEFAILKTSIADNEENFSKTTFPSKCVNFCRHWLHRKLTLWQILFKQRRKLYQWGDVPVCQKIFKHKLVPTGILHKFTIDHMYCNRSIMLLTNILLLITSGNRYIWQLAHGASGRCVRGSYALMPVCKLRQ